MVLTLLFNLFLTSHLCRYREVRSCKASTSALKRDGKGKYKSRETINCIDMCHPGDYYSIKQLIKGNQTVISSLSNFD